MNNPDHIHALELFNEKAERVLGSSFVAKIRDEELKLEIKIDRLGVQTFKKGPGDEAIDALVLTLRFFIQDNEPSSFRNLSLVYPQLPISRAKKEDFDRARKALNEFLDSKSFLELDNEELTYKQIFETFVYGGLAHANKAKKKEYDEWMASELADVLVYEFVTALVRILGIISYVRNLNADALTKLKKT